MERAEAWRLVLASCLGSGCVAAAVAAALRTAAADKRRRAAVVVNMLLLVWNAWPCWTIAANDDAKTNDASLGGRVRAFLLLRQVVLIAIKIPKRSNSTTTLHLRRVVLRQQAGVCCFEC